MKANLKAAPIDQTFDPVSINPDLKRKREEASSKLAKALAEVAAVDIEVEDERTSENARLANVRADHLSDAKNYRTMARTETDPAEKDYLLKKAITEEENARKVGVKMGLISPDDEAPGEAQKEPWMKRNRTLVAIVQIVVLVLAVVYFKGQFSMFYDWINELNHKLPDERKMTPYDLTSIQKFFFEKMVVFADLPLALLILFLIVPFVGFYVLPFLKSKRDFYSEFYEELTPWQRSVIATAFIFGTLFYLALSHSVKP